MIIKNRKDIEVPKEYIRSFEVPDDLQGRALSKAIRIKIKNDWSYLDLRDAKLRYAHLRESKLRYADFTFAKLHFAALWKADLTGAQNINFSWTMFTCRAKHARIILIPEIEWGRNPIAAVMPEGDQTLLIAIGCRTYTPEEWVAFTNDHLRTQDENAREWYKAHMEAAIKKAYELEAEWRKSVDCK